MTQYCVKSKTVSGIVLAALLAVSPVAAGLGVTSVLVGPVRADTASAKAQIDAAKASGIVGEQGDGFIGFVQTAAPDPSLQAAVAELNAGRAAVYRETAAKTGVAPDAAGQAVAVQLFNKMPVGQYYRPIGGVWTRK